MTTVLLLPAQVRLNLVAGERLLDALDERATPLLPLACRAMNCGICRLQLMEGAEAIQPATERELRLLRKLGAAANVRLGCQLVVDNGSAETEVVLTIDRPG